MHGAVKTPSIHRKRRIDLAVNLAMISAISSLPITSSARHRPSACGGGRRFVSASWRLISARSARLISTLISGVSRRLLFELGVIEIEQLLPVAQQRDDRHVTAAELRRELLDLRHNNTEITTPRGCTIATDMPAALDVVGRSGLGGADPRQAETRTTITSPRRWHAISGDLGAPPHQASPLCLGRRRGRLARQIQAGRRAGTQATWPRAAGGGESGASFDDLGGFSL